MKPFTITVRRSYTSWSGKHKFRVVHKESFETPEQLLAEASKWNTNDYEVILHEPTFWEDTRPPREDISVDWRKDDWRSDDFPF